MPSSKMTGNTMSESTVDTHLPVYGSLSPTHLRNGALLTSGALIGFALVLWIAANWDGLGKTGRFAVAGAALGAGGIAALVSASLTIPGLLLAFLSVGGLLALIGQTYQTGADTWQLFAAWAALGLPFALAARSDAVWAPLVAVVFTALTLWQSTTELAHSLMLSRSPAHADASQLFFLLMASWLPAVGSCALLSPGSIAAPYIGHSTRWSFRLAVVLTLVNVTGFGIAGLFTGGGPSWSVVLPAIVMLGGVASWLSLRGERDALLLACAALAIDSFLVSGLVETATQCRASGV